MGNSKKFFSKQIEEGETIFNQGDTGDCVYVIMKGSIDIYKETGGGRSFIARLGRGDIFGELAILTREPRSASAIASSPTELIMFRDKALHMALLKNDLPILIPLIKQLIFRLRDVEEQNITLRTNIQVLEKEIAELRESN